MFEDAFVKVAPYMDFFAWAALLCYSGCFVPQIVENYRYKSTKGLSDYYLLASMGAQFGLLYYVFCSNLLFPYKIMVPIECSILLFMVFQRFHYEGVGKNKVFLYSFGGSIALLLAFLPFAFVFTEAYGAIFGWFSFVCFTLNQLPQLFKVHFSKSVEGFSFAFISIFALALFLELFVGVVKHLPAPTIFMTSRGLLVYLIFCFYFWRYRKQFLRSFFMNYRLAWFQFAIILFRD